MRLLKLNLIAAVLLLVGAGSASAFKIDMSSNYTGGLAAISDTVTVTVKFDTEAALSTTNRLLLLAFGVHFDPGVLAYDQAASSAAAMGASLLQVGAMAAAPDLMPAASCMQGGSPTYPTEQCGLYPLDSTQVQVEYFSSGLLTPLGVPGDSVVGGDWIATLVFHVIGVGDGHGEIELVFDTITKGSGLTLQSGPTATGPWTYFETTPSLVGSMTGSGAVLTPEPTTAILLGLGLAGLGIAGRRRA